jgi:PQQ-dependent dehydrogenase (methanol/ethanol family)
MHRPLLLSLSIIAIASCALAGCGTPSSAERLAAAQVPQSASSPSSGVSADADDQGNWVRPAKDYASTRFSSLAQITPQSVKQLGVKVTFSTGFTRGHEAAPLVVDGTMYIVTPFPDILYALDLTRPGYPMKWKYDPKVASSAQGVACCDVVNRGASYADGVVVYNTLDNRTVAIDVKTGQPKWTTKLGEISRGETMTMAPLIVKDKVIVGNSGGEMGVRGWLTALDLKTGGVRWRAYSTGPDKDVLIGARFKPYYPAEKGADLGVHSWPGDGWKQGGGAAWGWVSYDPSSNLIFYGTSNPGPWNAEQRPGDNKWTSGTFARDADTGEAVWFYQAAPHDLWDYDGVNENVLVDLNINGSMRKTMLKADRNGYLYVIDRGNGSLISADPFVFVTSTMGIDMKTGRPKENKEKAPSVGTVVRNVCPAAPGGKDWQPTAYSPRTGYLYIPGNNLCMDYEGMEANYIAGTPYVGANVKMYPGPGGNRGEFIAWDPVARRKVWSIKETFPVWSGVVVTASDVAFYGTMDGWFKAVNAKTGEPLWQFKVGSGIVGQPVTYRGPDGKQYVAVLAGVGGWSGAILAGSLDARDGTAALGMVNAMADLKQATTKGGMLYVFGLP